MNYLVPEEALHVLGCPNDLKSFEWALLTALNVWIQDKWIPLRVRVEFGKGAEPAPRVAIACGPVQLVESLADAKHAARALRGEIPLTVGSSAEVLATGNWNATAPVEYWPWYTGVGPCYRLEAPLPTCHGIQKESASGPLINAVHALPVASSAGDCFMDVLAAMQFWFTLPTRPDRNGLFRGICEVIVPPGPGHVLALEAQPDGSLLVELSPGLERTPTLVRLTSDDGLREPMTGLIHGNQVTFPAMPSTPFCIYVFCAAELIAHYRGSPDVGIRSHPKSRLNLDTEQLIISGESETCEFKTASGLPSAWKDTTWEQVFRTVAGFANSHGGVLLIGVNDESEVIGIGADLAGDDRDREFNCLRNRCQERLSGSPRIDVSAPVVRERMILRVEVRRSSAGTPVLKDGNLLVRAGSTTRQATHAEHRRIGGNGRL